jgi:hypothetical protein
MTDIENTSDLVAASAEPAASQEVQATTESQPSLVETVPPVVADPIATAKTAVESAAVDEKKAVENKGHEYLHKIFEFAVTELHKIGADIDALYAKVKAGL